MKINWIGAGNLGKTIAALLHQKGYIIQGVCNRTKLSSIKACEFIGAGVPFDTIQAMPPADIIFITTPDDCLQKVASNLAKSFETKKGSLVYHCSGSLDSNILSSLQAKGASLASIHPMHSFADPSRSLLNFSGTFCAGEGDKKALEVGLKLFQSIGAQTFTLKGNKALYHAAGVMSSNYLVTLAEQARKCLIEAGVESSMAMPIVNHLMAGTLKNLQATSSPKSSLTGPVQRGDAETIQQHIQALEKVGLSEVYKIMGHLTFTLAQNEQNKSLEYLFKCEY